MPTVRPAGGRTHNNNPYPFSLFVRHEGSDHEIPLKSGSVETDGLAQPSAHKVRLAPLKQTAERMRE